MNCLVMFNNFQLDVKFLCQINQIFTSYPLNILIFFFRGRSVVGLLMVVTCTPDVPEKKKSVDTEVEYIVDLALLGIIYEPPHDHMSQRQRHMLGLF